MKAKPISTTTVLLVLLLSSSCWRPSHPLPVMGSGPVKDACVFYARSLLDRITEVLTQGNGSSEERNLFEGIDCSRQNVELNAESKTAIVCAPQELACSEMAQTDFDEDTCLTSIENDLLHYHDFLSAHPDPESFLSTTILSSLDELLQNCFARSVTKVPPPQEEALDRLSSFDERLSLCKVLRGFQVRTITINRAIGYISSGEHKK